MDEKKLARIIAAMTMAAGVIRAIVAVIGFIEDGSPQAIRWLWGSIFITAAIIVCFVKTMKYGRRLSGLILVVIVIIFFIMLSYQTNSMKCTTVGYCPNFDEHGNPLATNLRETSIFENEIGPAIVYEVDLELFGDNSTIGEIIKDIQVASGQTITVPIFVEHDAPKNIGAGVRLEDGEKLLAESTLALIKPGAWNNLNYQIPEQFGQDEIQVSMIITLLLLYDRIDVGEPKWSGEVYVATGFEIQPEPIELFVPTPNTNQPEGEPLIGNEEDLPGDVGSIHETNETEELNCTEIPMEREVATHDWIYIVKPGDTLPGLAGLFYKDREAWDKIYEKNQHIIGENWGLGYVPQIHPGQVIIIPSVSSPVQYNVQEGDSLDTISPKFYGFGGERLWCNVYMENISSIGKDPQRLSVGQVISIYPLAIPQRDEIWVIPGDAIVNFALAYYLDQGKYKWLCLINLKELSFDCDYILPREIIRVPDKLEKTLYKVENKDTWDNIAQKCYGESDLFHVRAIQLANRTIVGINPRWLRVGQVLTLYGCHT